MKLRFAEKQITFFANKYNYSRAEEDVTALREDVQIHGYLTKGQLRMVAQWKAPRRAGHVEKNSDEYVKEITGLAFAATDERSRIEMLTILDGVAWPTASVLLHLFHKDKYPILDFRALWSYRLDVPKQYSYSFWWPYVEFCREVAERNSVSMRVLDRALWQYSNEKQAPLARGPRAFEEIPGVRLR